MLGYKSRGDGDRAGFRASAKPIASEPPIAGAPTIAPSGASGQAAGGLMGPAGVKACGKARTPWEGCVASLPSPSSEVRGACRAIRSASSIAPRLASAQRPYDRRWRPHGSLGSPWASFPRWLVSRRAARPRRRWEGKGATEAGFCKGRVFRFWLDDRAAIKQWGDDLLDRLADGGADRRACFWRGRWTRMFSAGRSSHASTPGSG